MARIQSKNMGLTLVFIAAMCACSSAQPICQPPIISLQPCIAYISSNASGPPPQQCCTQLANLVQTQAQCLCAFLNAVPNLPINMNQTQAITLPGACNVQAPPLSQCNAAAGTLTPAPPSVPAAGSPPAAPGPASASAQGGVSPPSPSTSVGVPASKGGSKAGPNKPQSSSATSSTMLGPLLVFLLAASASSSF